jgi:electron transfer flavoprotein beta subunit
MMKIVVAIAPDEPDSAALEAALELRDAADGGEVVAITLAPPEDREGLLSALALGADRGVHITHDWLGDIDPIATARALADALGGESGDLVLCGAGATGVALAALLGLPRVAGVRSIDARPDNVTVERDLEGGTVELIEVRLPAVLTVQPGAYKLRYASLTAVRQALSKPVDVMTASEIDAAARAAPMPRAAQDARAEMIDGGPAEIAARIASIIRSQVA